MIPVLEMKQVKKHYRMGGSLVHALDGVDLSIMSGDFVAIVGPSGSGKSTLMHLLGFLDQPTSGEILFEGRDVSRITPNERARIRSEKIGFVFQSFNLLPRLSVKQNVLLPHYYRKSPDPGATERAIEALATVGMSERQHHRPNQLSGGQRQRVAIARALTNNPSLILADEPTGNLDSNTASSILDLFTGLNERGRTVVIVTHDPNVARRTRRQLHVNDGKIFSDIRT
ncbi:MAG: ABC transporter ATP-binding protein [Candidatus Methylacidiphilales bacterium]|nr:ABC transporter ATP-binding protein [Candidatus Methylacidiphilales bacterium]